MNDDDWYFAVGRWFGVLPAIVAFFASWWYCVEHYGYLLGFGFGWLPSVILAVIVFFAVAFLWGLAAAAVAYYLLPTITDYIEASRYSGLVVALFFCGLLGFIFLTENWNKDPAGSSDDAVTPPSLSGSEKPGFGKRRRLRDMPPTQP